MSHLEIGRYCCFWCPAQDDVEKPIEAACPTCGRPYSFPLEAAPATVGRYKVLKALGRGFYASTYVAERSEGIRTRKVLKVTPVEIYRFFPKDFEAECARHAAVADGADFVVGLDDTFLADIKFGDCTLSCHVAVLDYLDGRLLSDYLAGRASLAANTAAQIAADLVRMKAELERDGANHNDLHAANIVVQTLTQARLRQGAMDPSVRAMAIDLGSLAPDRRSGGKYKGDLHWIAEHIDHMATILLEPGDAVADLDARVALALRMIAQGMSPAVEHQRTPSADDLVAGIEKEYFRTAEPWRPWRSPLVLKSFKANYNAQTLDAWHVPQLLVDPEDQWSSQIEAPGPLVMTGMRGCGKTLLLRALQFHARAARHRDEATDEPALQRIRSEKNVGLFVSAQRLLDVSQTTQSDVRQLFARLYVAYALEGARALAHLQDLARDEIAHEAQQMLAATVAAALEPTSTVPTLASVEQLERHLVGLLEKVSRSNSPYSLASHPSNAFPGLAEALRRASPLWNGSQVLFLLDDVSTRYMSPERIEELLSALIFQNPTCSFKITSEAQTIFLSLKSPGQVHPAGHWRDFATFDLGAAVHARLKRPDSTQFVDNILSLRARFYPPHPRTSPSDFLGDLTLEDVAKAITSSTPDSKERKRVYRGISALAGVCVGDIGSVITLYEDIVMRSAGKSRAADDVQTAVYQDFCSRHLYLLDRRGSALKDVATSFAEASYELLMQSAKSPKRGTRGLRQYSSLYVRMTSGDLEEQRKRLRELVDAGVFVFTGGAPRTKTRDTNPIHQFKLIFRKIYGLANYIGLAERDRFELSGKMLEDWLGNPGSAKDILLRNLRIEYDPVDVPIEGSAIDRRPLELPFDFPPETAPACEVSPEPPDVLSGSSLPLPTAIPVTMRELPSRIDTLVLGLGFEERTTTSIRRLLQATRPAKVLAIRYAERGRSDEILAAVANAGSIHEEIPYEDLDRFNHSILSGSVVVDVTGLAKPAIFGFVRGALRGAGALSVAYTSAETYYPREVDLRPVLEATEQENHHKLLLALKTVLTGEEGPYHLAPLLSNYPDGTRMRGLYAFASSKHERLFQLVEERHYDFIRVMAGADDSPRRQVARIAAEVAVRGAEKGAIDTLDSSDPGTIIAALGEAYEDWYVRGGLNVEMGLTGNKLETVAAAALSAAVHVNQVWYVRPSRFDVQRFTTGVGETRCFRLVMP